MENILDLCLCQTPRNYLWCDTLFSFFSRPVEDHKLFQEETVFIVHYEALTSTGFSGLLLSSSKSPLQ